MPPEPTFAPGKVSGASLPPAPASVQDVATPVAKSPIMRVAESRLSLCTGPRTRRSLPAVPRSKPAHLISIGILPMQLADNVKHFTAFVNTDGASPADPLARSPLSGIRACLLRPHPSAAISP